MKCRVHLQCLIMGLALSLISGCSFSRGSQVSRNSEPKQNLVDEEADDAPVKTASADDAAPIDADGPPPQPGVKTPGGSRKKLTGWLSKGTGKSNAIPLDRTDKQADEEAAEEEDSGWWKEHSPSANATAQNSQSSKSKEPEALSLSSSNPFER